MDLRDLPWLSVFLIRCSPPRRAPMQRRARVSPWADVGHVRESSATWFMASSANGWSGLALAQNGKRCERRAPL